MHYYSLKNFFIINVVFNTQNRRSTYYCTFLDNFTYSRATFFVSTKTTHPSAPNSAAPPSAAVLSSCSIVALGTDSIASCLSASSHFTNGSPFEHI